MAKDEERDDDRDDVEDAEDDEKETDSEEEEEDKDEEDEDEDSNDSDEDEDDESDDSEDEDDNKPITRKELRDILKKDGNRKNAKDRVKSSKDRKNDRSHSNNSPKTEERLSKIEQTQRKTELLESKRMFGYENGLSPRQVDTVFRMTKRPTAKFLKTPYVKAALDVIAQEESVRDNTPSSGGAGSFRGKGGKSWDKLKPEEKQQNFAARRRAILDSKKR